MTLVNQPCYTSDTSTEALAVQLDGLRRMSPQRRLEQAMALTAAVRKMALDAIVRMNPQLDDRAIKLRFIELAYGKDLADGVAAQLSENPA